MNEHPSDHMQPRRKRHGCVVTRSACQASNEIRRLCFFPGPCCGNRHARCEQYTETTVVLPSSHNSFPTLLLGKQHCRRAFVLATITGYFESSEIRSR